VKGLKTGKQSLTVGSSTSSTDPNATNNTASTTITVEKRQAVKCRVPKLKGLTKAFAKTLLKAVNCRLGKATGKGKISKQAKKPGSVLPAGTKVNVTLRK
jgi:beta-lactam-binding protein with PASTA domain